MTDPGLALSSDARWMPSSAARNRLAQACRLVLALGGMGASQGVVAVQLDQAGGVADAAPARPPADAGEVSFDPALLKERGIDPGLAEYFRQAPRFRPGMQPVELLVNGVAKGKVVVRFDADGQPCISAALLERAGLRAPVQAAADEAACQRLADALPQVLVRQQPAEEQLALIVPPDALLPHRMERRSYSNGGTAGLLNYEALAMQTHDRGRLSQYRSLRTEAGFNAGGWAVRSRQSYASVQGRAQFDHLYAYASRTWEKTGANVQVGQLNLASPMHAVGAFTGIQIQPEAALAQQALGPGASVSGVAHSPSRVEVRQSGVVIHSTVVPSGPFTLDDLPVLSRKLDLEVTVIEEAGGQQQFIVPAATLQGGAALGATPGYFLAAGQVRRLGNYQGEQPGFITANKRWVLGRQTTLSAGFLAAQDYHSIGWSMQRLLGRSTNATVQQLASNAPRKGLRGTQALATLSTTLSPTVGASLTAGMQTRDFRTLTDTTVLWEDDQIIGREKNQFTAAMSWSGATLGAFSASYSRQSTFNGHVRDRAGLSWSRMFGRTSVSLTLQRAMGGGVGNNDQSAYLSVNVPLGRNASSRFYASHDQGRGLRAGARVNQQLRDTLGYTLAAERTPEGSTDLSGRVNLLPRYAQLDVGLSRRQAGSTSYDASLRGGVAFHGKGVTLSPYALRDTFGVLKLGDAAGIKVRTPAGPVWTDARGMAVASQLPAYRVGRLEVDTASLPRNVDVGNGYREIEAGRGSVHWLPFEVITVRRLLLAASTADGAAVPKGSGVYDAQKNYVTTVLEGGKIFLTDANALADLHVVRPDESTCALQFEVLAQADTRALFETAEAQCQPR